MTDNPPGSLEPKPSRETILVRAYGDALQEPSPALTLPSMRTPLSVRASVDVHDYRSIEKWPLVKHFQRENNQLWPRTWFISIKLDKSSPSHCLLHFFQNVFHESRILMWKVWVFSPVCSVRLVIAYTTARRTAAAFMRC